jgi:hypothetical protein
MEKKCLIFMPTNEPDGYAKGHFDRVYQYIIVSACKSAGFKPVKANDPSAIETPMDILKNIIESEVVICDLSSKNANAQYGFVIRQALGLPVTLIKDMKTTIAFNAQEFGLVEYDESLRIDTVQKEVETLTAVLTKSYENRVVTNALLSRLDIGKVAEPEPEPVYHEEPKKEENRMPLISPIPDYVGEAITQVEEFDKLKTGDFLFHVNHGKGEIKSMNKMAKDRVAQIQFDSGTKLLVLAPSGIFRKIR